MMRCPNCGQAAHVRTSKYMSVNVKESYLQCQNVYCSTTFKTHESIFEIIRAPEGVKKPEPAPPETKAIRNKVKGCYSSPFSHNQERQQ
ncbi:Ogr/Delta-like zinc finger protein [Raoultella planticola]|uniref:ogr/Delta-like zinc finger family protein n=1 Tax=Raoultella planticola TaxID=575 RepID=UPI00104FEBF6|nr:ogr/Delta-like zinc finger family protein [Raoultella planticola]TCL48152.1 Ogr/Delta-like zinc finger protein [Raoultella planticola]